MYLSYDLYLLLAQIVATESWAHVPLFCRMTTYIPNAFSLKKHRNDGLIDGRGLVQLYCTNGRVPV